MTKRMLLGVVALLLVIASAYASFYIAPEERTMGVIQRIFYFHVASAWAGFSAFLICFVANLLYVWRRDQKYDWLGVSAAEVGLAFTTIVLITGPIWAHPVWGIWWTWDVRLTTTLVLWLIYVSYLVFRRFSDSAQTPVLAAVLAIFGALDVPLVYFSIWFFRTQHPQPVIGGGGSLDPRMWHVLLINWLAFSCFAFLVCWARFRLELLHREVEATHAMKSLGDTTPTASLPLRRAQ